MMRKSASALFILILLSVIAFSSTQDPPKNASQDSPKRAFALLLERAKKSDATLDFKELRMAYTETADYNPYVGDRETRKQMFAALNAKEFDSAVESAEKILATNFVEINAHFVAYMAHRESGHSEKARFHKFMFDGLVKSITSSGNGKTAETAYVVITTDEEYTLFNILGLRPAGQVLITQNGHSFDRMTATNPKTNETVVYFFNIDKPFNWRGQSLKK